MLKITKTTNLTGISTVGGTQAAYMTATISTEDSNISFTKTVTNKELYNANKDEVRKDMMDFETEVYSVQDDMMSETV